MLVTAEKKIEEVKLFEPKDIETQYHLLQIQIVAINKATHAECEATGIETTI